MVHRIESDDTKVKTSSTFVLIFASYNEDRKTFSMTQYASESARIIMLKSSIYRKLSRLAYQDPMWLQNHTKRTQRRIYTY